jgi:hypothetical protein
MATAFYITEHRRGHHRREADEREATGTRISGSRFVQLSVAIGVAALLLLPVGSGLAKTNTGGGRANESVPAVHLPRAICHQYCYGADQALAFARRSRSSPPLGVRGYGTRSEGGRT